MSENENSKESVYKFIYICLFFVLAIAVGGWIYLNKPEKTTVQTVPVKPVATALPTAQPTSTPKAAEPQATPTPDVLLPTPIPTPTLPPLNQSDDTVKNALTSVDGSNDLLRLVTNDEIIRKSVRAIYQLSRGNVVKQYRPVQSPQKTFKAEIKTPGDENSQAIYFAGSHNFNHYSSHVALLEKVPTQAAITLYQIYSPLLEQAYGELGLGEGSFRSTLISAIDIMLSTPDVDDDFLLIRPSVMYKFADPQLEALPNAQKLLIRMGRENRNKVIAYLNELKNQL